MTHGVKSVPDERLDLYDEAVPWAVRERHLRRYVDAVCWVMEYRKGDNPDSWVDLGCGVGYGLDIISVLLGPTTWVHGIDNDPALPWFGQVGNGRFDLLDIRDLATLGWRQTVWSAVEVLEHLDGDSWHGVLSAVAAMTTGAFVGTCPIGHDGPNPKNPHHLFEPTRTTLNLMLYDHFTTVYQREYGRATLTTGEEQETAMFLCVP